MGKQINVAWMYPDILNLHGERGNAQALKHVADLLNVKMEIDRIDDIEAKIDFNKYDILLFNCGELKVVPTMIKYLKPQLKEFKKYVSQDKIVFSSGTTSAFLGNEIIFQNGNAESGLGILNAEFKERDTVIGDDIYFELDDGMEITGSQIQMVDIDLDGKEKPFGTIKYGYGNNGGKYEGGYKHNVFFTNCLAPILVKNPWLAEKLIRIVCKQKQIKVTEDSPSYELEKNSLQVTKQFINNKVENQ